MAVLLSKGLSEMPSGYVALCCTALLCQGLSAMPSRICLAEKVSAGVGVSKATCFGGGARRAIRLCGRPLYCQY